MASARTFAFIPFLGAALAVLHPGCTPVAKVTYTPEEVQQALAPRVEKTVLENVVIPFEIDDEIRQVALKVTEGLRSDREKANALVGAIVSKTQLSIAYDSHSNKTARDVFRSGKGNCLAYTNLFIGMAREVGLKAVYIDVVTIERISREAEVIVNNGHITGGVYYGPTLMMIDFTRTAEREYGGFKVIDDLEAIANYYNNQGFLYGYYTEREADFDPLDEEIKMYKMALEVFPDFHRARNNLGVAYKRRGNVDGAIAQYKRAIAIDPTFAEAHSNLGSAYYSIGRADDAIKEFEIATKNSGSNAYFFHHLGIIEYQQGRYRKAIAEFKKALARKKDLADAVYYLGEAHLALQEKDEAIKQYERTLELDPNYLSARSRLDMLRTKDNQLSRQQ